MAFTIVGDAAVVSGNCSDSRKAAVFTGGNTDDYYQINTWATDRVTANDTRGTIIAWIMPGDKTGTYSIINAGDNDAVEFLEFNVEAGKLACRCTDATTAQFISATNSVVIQPHVWTHVAVVQNADLIGPKFYVNGVRVASTNSTTTDLNEWFNNCDGIDKGCIGAANKSGNAAITNEFVGGISDLKYYNSALTDEQIADDYRGTVLTTGLTDYWKMADLSNETTAANTMTEVSDVYLTPTYNEFISRVRKFGAVVADTAGFNENMGRMSVMFINAA